MPAVPRILVVDDEFFVANSIAEALKFCGLDVAGIAGSPEQANDIVSATQVDAAVIDVNLGESDSASIARCLKAKKIPFAVISGYTRDHLDPELMTAPFFPKPFDTKELVFALLQLIDPAVQRAH